MGEQSQIALDQLPGISRPAIFATFGARIVAAACAGVVSLATVILHGALSRPSGCPTPVPGMKASFRRRRHRLCPCARSAGGANTAGASLISSSVAGTRITNLVARSPMVRMIGFWLAAVLPSAVVLPSSPPMPSVRFVLSNEGTSIVLDSIGSTVA